jgi:methylated-DNA-[protein]-cysteine S-methyltransferase
MDDAGIYAREFEPLGRAVEIGVASGKVVGVSFPDAAPADAEYDHPLLDRIDDYLAGDADHFDDVPVALTVPTDRRRVLEAVRKLPYGETVRRSRVANLAGLDSDDDEDLRLVEEALRENPVPLFVPDHRVEGVHGATPGAGAEPLGRLERA